LVGLCKGLKVFSDTKKPSLLTGFFCILLSDEALEKQIARDLMFRRFIDLSLSEAVPDHSTIWRFRQLLNTENLLEPLLEMMLCTSSSSDRDLCSITRESANEFCWVFFQDILGVLWLF
jgi:hypothetical protein